MTVVQNDILRADSLMVFDGADAVVNTFQFIKQSSSPIDESLVLVDLKELLEALYTTIIAVVNLLLVFDRVRGFNLSQNVPLGDISYSAISAGTDTADSVAPGVCPVLNFPTATPHVQLRKFGPPYTEAENGADGRLGTTLILDYADMLTLMLAAQVVTNGTYQYGYLSPKTGGFVLPTAGTINDIAGYQRRRKQGRGS